MENNEHKVNTGNKGVFPGSSVSQQTAPHNVPNQTPNPSHTAPSNPAPNQEQPHQNSKQVESNPSSEEDLDIAPDSDTYMNLQCRNAEGEVSGIIDIDLISFRERGRESRYLSVSSVGADASGNQSETRIYINNKEDFEKLKLFMSNLNWND